MKILLVEDDLRVAGALRSALVRHGYDVQCAVSGSEALDSDDDADLVLLDMCLPDMDGFEVCRRFRARSDVPIIAVTARGEAEARVRGLRMGADDYVVKPCGLAELKARMEAVMRRSRNAFRATAPGTVITIGDLSIDLDRKTVTSNGERVPLSRKEYEIVAVLAAASGSVVTRDQLMSSVWRRRDGNFRTLDVHIATLRRKLNSPELIETVRGVGYRLVMQ
ncbi:response regulator transcription factor [Nonomuraea sp. NPDC050786]|uniref:response regulator transcription factor n=1 Tax=Nonomuraea sp. NPDC050786 TaxID=3154840 RepID=UPI00340DC031